MYFYMRLLLVDRWPLLNVRFFDGQTMPEYADRKVHWLRDRFYNYFWRMRDLCAGNSRLFVRVQYND